MPLLLSLPASPSLPARLLRHRRSPAGIAAHLPALRYRRAFRCRWPVQDFSDVFAACSATLFAWPFTFSVTPVPLCRRAFSTAACCLRH